MINPFSADSAPDVIYFERNGARIGPYKCHFSSPKVTLFYKQLDVEDGDKLIRILHDKEVSYTVEDTGYSAGQLTGTPHYYLQIRKDTAISRPSHQSTTNHINIQGSTGIQIGDHNVQNLEVALKEVLASIDNADAPKEEREEAKSRLNTFLAHPLVSAAVGASLPVALGLLS